MKQPYFILARLLAVAFVWVSLSLTPALAQRTDSLMVRSDAISAYAKTYLNNVLYYLADDGVTGFELWRTDGTKAGTRLVKDIRPGWASAFVSDTSYYTGVYNTTTYRYDYDLATVRSYLRYVRPYVFGNQLYFWADDGVNGVELWRSDGTAAGTTRVTDLIAGPFDSGEQADILYGGYSNRFAVSASGKLQFWSYLIQNTIFETSGTPATTRGVDVQAIKYVPSTVSSVNLVGGKSFATTSLYQKGKYYYSLQQLADSLTPAKPIVLNSLASPTVLLSDARGPLWMTRSNDDKLNTYSFARLDSGRTKVLKKFDIVRPTTANTRSQYVSTSGQVGDQLLIQLEDTPSSVSGKGTQELWRLDLKTDSLRLMKRYTQEQTIVSNQTRYVKGSEDIYTAFNLPNGYLVIQGTADTTGTAYRYTVSRYDFATNKFQVLEDSIENFNYQQWGVTRKAVFMTRRGPKDPYQVWTTDGKTRTVLQTLGVSDGMIVNNVPTVGLVASQYTFNYNAKKQFTGYKLDVWRVDTVAAAITRLGRVNNKPTWIGTHIGVNGVLYGNSSGTLHRISAATPGDSIRQIASFNGWNSMVASENNFGVVNGKILAKPAANSPLLLAIDPAAAPSKCLVGVTPKTRNGNPYSWIKDLAYCPAKDSVVTLKASPLILSNNSGEINTIYPHTVQWLRDSTVMQSGPPALDSLQLSRPQQGQYTLTLRGLADGCTANDSWKLYYSAPSLALTPSLKQADRKGLSAIARGGYLNNGSTYPAVWGRTNADGSVAAVAGAADVSYYGHTTGWLDELVAGKYEPRYGTYTVKIADALSCSTTTAFTYTDKTTLLSVAGGFNALQNGATVCDQSVLSYSATAGGGKAPYTYRLFADSQPIATGSSSAFTAVAPGTNGTGSANYMIEATDADGNKMLTPQQILFFAARPAIALTSTSATASATRPATLSVAVANYNFPTFRWAKDGQLITGVAGKSLSATSGGVYSVTVGSGTVQNCQRTSQLTLVTGSGRIAATEQTRTYPAIGGVGGVAGGVADPLLPQRQLGAGGAAPEPMRRGELQVMPNPARDVTRLQLDLPKPAGVAGTLLTTDGKVLQTWEDARPFEQYTTEVNLGSQPAGVYILRVEAGGQTYTKRIVKQ